MRYILPALMLMFSGCATAAATRTVLYVLDEARQVQEDTGTMPAGIGVYGQTSQNNLHPSYPSQTVVMAPSVPPVPIYSAPVCSYHGGRR